MKKRILTASLLLTACLLSGCAALLERSYSVVEPYADRYWDSSAEDTLRAETYQDLVNSLLMLIEQHAEEGVIRCYGEVGEYSQTSAAKSEVCRETMLGSYLLDNLRISSENGANYSTLTCTMTYREDAEDISSLMTLSDTQSLVDLLRLTVREERDKLTAHFAYDTPREDVIAAVESFWQELCRSEMEADGDPAAIENVPKAASEPPEDTAEPLPEDAGEPPSEADVQSEEPAENESPDAVPANAEEPLDGETPEEPPEEVIEYPPCPWGIRFYPDKETAEIVEVLLKK